MAYPAYAASPQASAFRTAVPGTGLDAVKRISDTYDSVDLGLYGSVPRMRSPAPRVSSPAPRVCSPARTAQVITHVAPARCWSPVRAVSWSQDGLQLPASWRGLTSSHRSIVAPSVSPPPPVPVVTASAVPLSMPAPAVSPIATLEQELVQSRRQLHALQLQREAEQRAAEARHAELLAELEELRPLRALHAKVKVSHEEDLAQRAPTSPTNSAGSMTRAEVDELVRARVESSLQELVRGLLPGSLPGLPGQKGMPVDPGADCQEALRPAPSLPRNGAEAEASQKSLTPLPTRGAGAADAADAATPQVAPWRLRKVHEEARKEDWPAEQVPGGRPDDGRMPAKQQACAQKRQLEPEGTSKTLQEEEPPSADHGITEGCDEAVTAADAEPGAGQEEEAVRVVADAPLEEAESEEVGLAGMGSEASEAVRAAADAGPTVGQEDEAPLEEAESQEAGLDGMGSEASEAVRAAADAGPTVGQEDEEVDLDAEEEQEWPQTREQRRQNSGCLRASQPQGAACEADDGSSSAGLPCSRSGSSSGSKDYAPVEERPVEPAMRGVPGQELQDGASASCSRSSTARSKRSDSSANSSSEAQDHPEVFAAQALGWPQDPDAADCAFMSEDLQAGLHSPSRSAARSQTSRSGQGEASLVEATPASWSQDDASPDGSGRSQTKWQSSRSSQMDLPLAKDPPFGWPDEMVLTFGQQVAEDAGTASTWQDEANRDSSSSPSRSSRRRRKDRTEDANDFAWPSDRIAVAYGDPQPDGASPASRGRSMSQRQRDTLMEEDTFLSTIWSSSPTAPHQRMADSPAQAAAGHRRHDSGRSHSGKISQRDPPEASAFVSVEDSEENDTRSGWPSLFTETKADRETPDSSAQPLARNGTSRSIDGAWAGAVDSGWHGDEPAAAWPHHDMAGMAPAFGEALEWPPAASASQEPDWSFPPWPSEAQSPSPTRRPALRRSATQVGDSSKQHVPTAESKAHSSSPSRRPPLRRSATQDDSISPSRRTLTWGTQAHQAMARDDADNGPNLKEHMAQFMPWGA